MKSTTEAPNHSKSVKLIPEDEYLFRKEFRLEQVQRKVTGMIRGRRRDAERPWIVQPRKMKAECGIL